MLAMLDPRRLAERHVPTESMKFRITEGKTCKSKAIPRSNATINLPSFATGIVSLLDT